MRRVLIATISMTTASGTVTYTRDLALALLRHGWLPIVYATHTGAQAELLREATIPVVTNLDSVGEAPDVIHGHHTLETLIAMTRFPDVPALFVCHDATAWHSARRDSRASGATSRSIATAAIAWYSSRALPPMTCTY